jgi:hypothetical protein
MTDRTSLSLLKRTIPSCSFPENIVLGDIIQNLFNLRVNYPRRFLHVSILLISDCTLRLLKKLVKRKLQEVIFGRTRRIVPELESWPVQELLGHTP